MGSSDFPSLCTSPLDLRGYVLSSRHSWDEASLPKSLPSSGKFCAHTAGSWKLAGIYVPKQGDPGSFRPFSETLFLKVNPPFLSKQTFIIRKVSVCCQTLRLCSFSSLVFPVFPNNRSTFFCGDCFRVVTSPLLRRHLQVFLDCPSWPQCTVRVKVGAEQGHSDSWAWRGCIWCPRPGEG